ncbi:hypothetical protein BVG19_g1992 [[Candida] boidinii]|nr:hypothetical protein BVG19_g1992 [[Candida] boidinii]OWB49407.1 hypothetical protein B5S27_g948 [[Candida] boidinii]
MNNANNLQLQQQQQIKQLQIQQQQLQEYQLHNQQNQYLPTTQFPVDISMYSDSNNSSQYELQEEENYNFPSSFDSRYYLYGLDWANVKNSKISRIALSSYREDSKNKLQVIYGVPKYEEKYTKEGGQYYYYDDLLDDDDNDDDDDDDDDEDEDDYDVGLETDEDNIGNKFNVDELDDNNKIKSKNKISRDDNDDDDDDSLNKPIDRFKFHEGFELSVNYPVTRLQWDPSMNLGYSNVDRFATTSECLRIYEVTEDFSSTTASNLIENRNNYINNNKIYNRFNKNKKLIEKLSLVNSKSKDFNQLAPLTSFDWNRSDPCHIMTCSVDTTCTLWDLSKGSGVAKTQLIAHDSEVFDVKFFNGDKSMFATCSNDGSIRVFDLRSLEHSTIIYEPPLATANSSPTSPSFASKTGGGNNGSLNPPGFSNSNDSNGNGNSVLNSHYNNNESNNNYAISPSSTPSASTFKDFQKNNNNNNGKVKPLLRLATSNCNPNNIATIESLSNNILILDLRYPGTPLRVLQQHSAPINSISWHPSKNYLLSGSDDCQILCYDLNKMEYIKSSLTRSKSFSGSGSNSHSKNKNMGSNGTTPNQSSSATNNNSNNNSNNNIRHGSLSMTPSSQLVGKRINNFSNDLINENDEFPIMGFNDEFEINQVCWNPTGDWIGYNAGKKFQTLKMDF